MTKPANKVVADWTAEQQRNDACRKGQRTEGRVEKGETLAAIAAELGIAVETKAGLRRCTRRCGSEPCRPSPPPSPAPNGLVANAAGVGGEGQILLKVTEVDDSNPGDVARQ